MDTIRIAVVDDSIFIRKAMVRMLRSEPRIEVIGVAGSGEELLEHLDEWKPDLISLDLSMPGMGGLRTLDEVMARRPTPVIILSSLAQETAPLTIEALHRGAVDFIDKQRYSLVDFRSLSQILTAKILEIVPSAKANDPAAELVTREIPVQSAIQPPVQPAAQPATRGEREPRQENERDSSTDGDPAFDALLIGASTGGPLAIQTVLEDLGEAFPLPVVIVQHMPSGFTTAFAERLNTRLPFTVLEASNGDRLLPYTTYLAPGGRHLALARSNDKLTVVLSGPDERSLHCPSVDRLFHSAAEILGARAIAVLLTGMGRDGAAGLAALAGRGAFTVAQDEASSVVFGMPRAAIERGAAQEILPLDRIGPMIRGLASQPGKRLHNA